MFVLLQNYKAGSSFESVRFSLDTFQTLFCLEWL